MASCGLSFIVSVSVSICIVLAPTASAGGNNIAAQFLCCKQCIGCGGEMFCLDGMKTSLEEFTENNFGRSDGIYYVNERSKVPTCRVCSTDEEDDCSCTYYNWGHEDNLLRYELVNGSVLSLTLNHGQFAHIVKFRRTTQWPHWTCERRTHVNAIMNEVPCLDGCEREQILTGCSVFKRYCQRELFRFINKTKERARMDTTIVFADFVEFAGICDGYGSATRPAMIGHAVAQVSLTQQSMVTMQIEVTPHEPKVLSERPFKLFVSISTDNSTEVNCTDNQRDVPQAGIVCQQQSHQSEYKGNPDDSGDKSASSSIAIAVVVSFVAGILSVFIGLFLLRYFRTKGCVCGKYDDEQSTRNDASKQVAQQVLQKHTDKKGGDMLYTDLDHGKDSVDHTYDKSQLTYESIKADEARDSHVYSTAQTPYERLGKSPGTQTPAAGNEHVYDGLDGKMPPAGGILTSPRPEHLFEEGRDSSTSAHNYFTLQNDNFRLSEQNASAAKQDTGGDNKDGDTGNTYFVLEKDKATESGAPAPQQQNKTDNTYFVLEKEQQCDATPSRQPGGNTVNTVNDRQSDAATNKADNTYFVLEKEQQSNVPLPRQPGGNRDNTDNGMHSDAAANTTDNTYFVLEKEDKVQATAQDDCGAPDNSYFVLEKDPAVEKQT